MIRVVVADDEELVREGLAAIVGGDPGLEVVATVADGAAAVDAVDRLEPDVVLMDVRMPGLDGIEATRRISAGPTTARVLILTTIELDDVVYDALRAGASGFLLKRVPRDQLWAGIRAVHGGDALLAPSVTRRLIETHLEHRAPVRPELLTVTDRQADVVRLVAHGLTNAEIARQLHLAESTVKGYVSEVLARHCDDVGRDPGEIRRSTQALVRFVDDPAEAERLRARGSDRPQLIGSSAEIVDQVGAYAEAGLDELIVPDWFNADAEASRAFLDRFHTEVAVAFR